jgi:hypothetical protein
VSVRGHIGANSIERGFQNLLRRVEGENIRLDEFFSRMQRSDRQPNRLASTFLGVSTIPPKLQWG